jgi:HD superfamily phosphohydrolase
MVDIPHETISLMMMNELNRQFGGKLELAIKIFRNEYKKQFLHQLVASQLDMDRLDYLSRDSFFTGVAEGIVGIDRIIKMLTVWNDQLAVDYKGIYSVEKFLIARRLMYWQVYLHKTVISAEYLLVQVLKRAKELLRDGKTIFTTPALKVFLLRDYDEFDFLQSAEIEGKIALEWYAILDDNDILSSVKEWQYHPDKVLSLLACNLINRKLFRTNLTDKPMSGSVKEKILRQITEKITGDTGLSHYFLITGEITNSAYDRHSENIKILKKDGKVKDLQTASDINLSALTKTVRKYFACFPKELDIY